MEGKKEENKLYEEKFEWLNSKECKVTHEVKEPIKNKHGKTVGFNTNETSFVGSYEEMEEALHNREFSRDKVLKQHQLEEARLEKLGKKPMKTPEMVRLEKNLVALGTIKNLSQAEDKLKHWKVQLDQENSFLEARKKTLAACPADGEEPKEEEHPKNPDGSKGGNRPTTDEEKAEAEANNELNTGN